MLRVACKDLGMEGCDFAVEGEKARKLEYKMLAHIRDEHPELMMGSPTFSTRNSKADARASIPSSRTCGPQAECPRRRARRGGSAHSCGF